MLCYHYRRDTSWVASDVAKSGEGNIGASIVSSVGEDGCLDSCLVLPIPCDA